MKKEIIKKGIIVDKHPLHSVPMVPLIVSLYGFYLLGDGAQKFFGGLGVVCGKDIPWR